MKRLIKYLFRESMIEPLVYRGWDFLRGRTFELRVHRGNLYDESVMKAIIRRVVGEASNCIDVGAHSGDFVTVMVDCAPLGCHYAVEPIPDLAEALRRRYPKVQVRQVALGEQADQAEFVHVVSNPLWSGFHPSHYWGRTEEIKKIGVEVCRLDDLLPADFKVDLLKVDVEGAEYKVFRGALRTLRNSRPAVLFEFFRDLAATFGTTPEMMYRLLSEECGLQMWLPDEWVRGWPPLTLRRLHRVFHNRLRMNFFAYTNANPTPGDPAREAASWR